MQRGLILLCLVVAFLASPSDAKKKEKKSLVQEFEAEESQLARKDGLVNNGYMVSRGKPTSQSSSYVWNGAAVSAGNGNDGAYGQNWNAPSLCSHTNQEQGAWWQVDLQALFSITQVNIWNRNDCCADRLLPAKILISSDGSTWSQCAYVSGTGVAGMVYTIACVGKGRYVRIQLDKNDYLTLCEVEVLANIAAGPADAQYMISRDKPTSQSSSLVWNGAAVSPANGNDGAYGENWNAPSLCSHTNQEAGAWWQVDLQEIFAISQVDIWNRNDCCPERLLPLKVLLSEDGKSWTQCAYLSGTGVAGMTYTVACNGKGRYVRIQLDKTDYLTLCEVEVWGNKGIDACGAPDAGEVGDLLSRNKPSSQSSSYVWNGAAVSASNGNDGAYGQNWNNPSLCSHTNQEAGAWWQVDLQGLFAITQVKIWNRNDCCANRLLPLRVELSNDGNTWTQCGYLGGVGQAGEIYTIPCPGSGRYVRIQLDKNDYLTLCEVEVWGITCAAPKPKPAPKPDPKPVPKPGPNYKP